MAQITTKSGDRGVTQLNPDRIASKCHPVIGIMGDIDELSCVLGLCGDKYDNIQTFLSEIMGYLYYRNADVNRINAQIAELEEFITTHNNSIPTWFVNPRGPVSLARAVCRRVERRVVCVADADRALPESERYMNFDSIMRYLNRLSDYFFVRSFERMVTEPELFKDELAANDEPKLFSAFG